VGQSISEAIDSVVDDVTDDTTEETTEETTSDETPTEGEGTLLDEEDEAEEEAEETDDEGEVEEEETADEEPDIFDDLTAEQLAEIKANPTLNKLRKSLMKGYSTKTTEHSQLVQLGNAYKQDPYGVLKAIAQQLGMEVAPPKAPDSAPSATTEDPGRELEELFGDQIGPKVRAVFDKWAEARFGQTLKAEVAPLRDALGRVVTKNEQDRMYSEESAFKTRHKDLSPDMEKAIVDLGNSGRIVPGNMSPSEYLETLYDIVSARMARTATKKTSDPASTKLARKIEANRRDREPVGVSGRGNTVKPVSKIPQAKTISQALDFAMDELEAEGR
jgi:hypothetical protein